MEDVKVINLKSSNEALDIYLETLVKSITCPNCGALTSRIHDYRTQIVRDVSILGKNTYLHVKKKRYLCACCNKRITERVSLIPKYQRTTSRLWHQIFVATSKSQTFTDIGNTFNISTTSVIRIFDNLSYSINNLPQVIAIDEFRGNSGGEKFQSIVTNPKRREVLDILPSRKSEDLYSYFGQFTNRNNVKYVVMDMSPTFKHVALNCFPNAKIVADKYHVVRTVSWAFENVRKRIQKDFIKDKQRYFKNSRKLLLKRYAQASSDQKTQIANMLSQSKELAAAYWLKEKFYEFMSVKNEVEARKLLSEWLMLASVSGPPEFKAPISTCENWYTEIIAAFSTGYTNGFTEGCNNKIKVLKRISYGVRNFDRFRKRILHIFKYEN